MTPRLFRDCCRHNSIRVTTHIYDEAMSAEKQKAHQKGFRQADRTVMRTASEGGIAASA